MYLSRAVQKSLTLISSLVMTMNQVVIQIPLRAVPKTPNMWLGSSITRLLDPETLTICLQKSQKIFLKIQKFWLKLEFFSELAAPV